MAYFLDASVYDQLYPPNITKMYFFANRKNQRKQGYRLVPIKLKLVSVRSYDASGSK